MIKPKEQSSEINQLQSWLSDIEINSVYDAGHVEDLKAQIDTLEEKSLLEELKEFEKVEMLLKDIDEHRKPIDYFFGEVKAFNLKNVHDRKKQLNDFCTSLLNRENIFSNMLNEFRRLEALERKLMKPEYQRDKDGMVTVGFALWSNSDLELLAVYDVDNYLALEQLYTSIESIVVPIWDLEKLREKYSFIDKEIKSRLDSIIELLKKSLNQTNWLFKGV